jgi:opine dehydrogenase
VRVTIIGAGNAGCVHAAKLYEKGIEICVCKNSQSAHSKFFDMVERESGFQAIDVTNDNKTFFVKPQLITRDVKEAIDFADIIMIMTTTLQHEEIAEKIAPYVRDGQIIALIPGYMGSLIFKRYIDKKIHYSEWETTAYNGRIVDEAIVRITFYNPRNAISCLPQTDSEYVLDKFNKLFCNTHFLRKNILESAFHNPNMIVHTIGVLFSSARIEYSQGDFWMYREAFTPSVINVIQAFDKQNNEILELFGCNRLDYFDAAKWRNSEDLNLDSMDVFRSFAQSSNRGPESLATRYISEDVPNGLCLFASIGKAVHKDTSIADSIINLLSALVNKDFKAEGRTIQKLLNTQNVDRDMILKAMA